MPELPDHLNLARQVLAISCFGVILVLTVFDVWAWIVYGRDATASAIIHEWSRAWPLLPFLVGMMVGHLFWASK